jgi:serine/threonine protein kinase
MLTGEPLFNANESTTLAEMHSYTPAPSPRRLNPDIPVNIEQIILKILSKEPSARYRTADQLGRILQTLLDSPILDPGDGSSLPVDIIDTGLVSCWIGFSCIPGTGWSTSVMVVGMFALPILSN